MQIPVTLHRLGYGSAIGAPDELEHGVFTTEDAAGRVLQAALAEARRGTLQVAPGKLVYTYPFATTVEADSVQAAIAAGYQVDFDRLMPIPEPEPLPVAAPVVEAAPDVVVEEPTP